jgi:hypothetical protein
MGEIAENLSRVRRSIVRTAVDCGREPESIRLVAVSKTFSADRIREALEAGQTDFGENYAVEFREKASTIVDPRLRWHFIGHLQSNKVKMVLGSATLIHSLDRGSLAEEIQKRCDAAGRDANVLIEVHTTDEQSKSGVSASDVRRLCSRLRDFPRIRVRGLMTMGPYADDPEASRKSFRILRTLRDSLRDDGVFGEEFSELSMGMSSDMHVAIQEGATIVRIGTAIFGHRTTTEG